MEKTKILALVGNSGSGKTVLEEKLINLYPNLFNKLKQCTTRQMRENESEGNPYFFINKEKFEKIKSILIGVIEPSSKFGNGYGTIAEYDKNKINTIILSEEGLLDLISKRKSNNLDIFIVGIERSLDTIPQEEFELRKDRSRETILKEFEVLMYAHEVLKVKDIDGTLNFVNPKDVVELCLNWFTNTYM